MATVGPGEETGVEQTGENDQIGIGERPALGSRTRGVPDREPEVPKAGQHETDQALGGRPLLRPFGNDEQDRKSVV